MDMIIEKVEILPEHIRYFVYDNGANLETDEFKSFKSFDEATVYCKSINRTYELKEHNVGQ